MTAEMSLRMKARRLGLTPVDPPAALLLPETPDPGALRVRELEAELRELRDRLPRLRLAFTSGEDHREFKLRRLPPLSDERIARMMVRVRSQHPKMRRAGSEEPGARPTSAYGSLLDLTAILRAAQPLGPSAREMDEYDEEVSAFYAAYEAYLRGPLAEYRARVSQAVRLQLCLVNEGTAPADDMHILLHLPDGIAVCDKVDRVRLPRPPVAPERPLGLLESFGGGPDLRYAHLLRHADLAPAAPSPPPNVSRPLIRPTRSTEVIFHVRALKHQMEARLRPLWLYWASFDGMSSFSIGYRIIAATVPRPVEARLHMVVRKAG